MEKDILAGVIGVEAEIKRRLDAEREKAGEWLEKEKKNIEKETVREENRLKQDFRGALETKRKDAEKRALETLNDARSRAEKLENITDEALRGIISKYIIRISPGAGHDSPDV
jgi:hypothetical protein